MLGVSACGEQAAAPTPAPPPSGVAFALLADNQLLRVSLPSGDVVASETVAPKPNHPAFRGALAFSRDERTLYVLPRRAGPGGELLLVDTTSMRVRGRFALEAGIVFQEIAVGPRTGRLISSGHAPAVPSPRCARKAPRPASRAPSCGS